MEVVQNATVRYAHMSDEIRQFSKDLSLKRKARAAAGEDLMSAMNQAKTRRVTMGDRVIEISKKAKKPTMGKAFLMSCCEAYFQQPHAKAFAQEAPEIQAARLTDFVYECVRSNTDELDTIKEQRPQSASKGGGGSVVDLAFEGLPSSSHPEERERMRMGGGSGR